MRTRRASCRRRAPRASRRGRPRRWRCWRSGEVLAGYQRLLELEAATAGTPLEKETPRVRKQVERDPRWKEQIAAYKRELEAKELLREAERAFREGNDKRGQSTIRKLLRKYPDTEAGEEAARRWPDLV